MTNVLLLPMLSGSGTSFEITNNSDWNDSIFFGALNSPTKPIQMVGQTVSGSNVITVANTTGLVPGQPITETAGIPAGAFIGALTAATTLTMVDSVGSNLNSNLSNVVANLTFQPVPLDLTGISFVSNLRPFTNSSESYLTIQTSDGTYNNGGPTGVLSVDIPYLIDGVPNPKIAGLFPGTYVMDIIAEGDGATINLFPLGPATVTVLDGVTDPLT